MSLFLVDVCYLSDVDTPRAVICLLCFIALLPFLDAETSDSTLSRLIVCVPPLALYTRHPLHVPLGLLDPRILGSFP